MTITYSSGEVENIVREIIVNNYDEPIMPESPIDLTADSITNSSVTLTWQPSTAQHIFNYVIYQDGKKVAETKGTSYSMEGLQSGKLVNFRVKTKDIYDKESIDDNSIGVKVPNANEGMDPLPSVSQIKATGNPGATPGLGGYSGTVTLSVTASDDDLIDRVDFYVKTVSAPESDYWKFPTTKNEGDKYSVSWLTSSAPEGNVMIKAVAYDSKGQSKTVTNTFLVDNESDVQQPPSWEPADQPPKTRIVGYLAGWATYGNYDILRDLDASRLTHLNYAFAVVGNDLKVTMSDPVQDPKNFQDLARLKAEYPHLKTLISVGGWGGSANFSEAAATAQSRKIFAQSAVEFIVKNGFDGVDLDWEYPVTGGGTGTYPNPADKENYPLFLKEIREQLDKQGQKDGKHYLLTIAGGATAGFASNTSLGISEQYLDYVQIMTYDIHGTWETKADYTAPLLDDNGNTYSVDQGVQAYLKAGVPAGKLVMGVPFYGYTYNVTSSENNGLRQPFSGSGSITYNNIVKNDLLNNGYVRYWDDGAKVPYLFNKETSTFISYDDEQSVGLKAEYIKSKGLGGGMIWELSQDHGNDLLQSLYNVLKVSVEDKTPPATTAIVSGEELSDSSVINQAIISLSAEDKQSGVAKIEYRFNDGEWKTYKDPITISTDGVTQVDFRSVDYAGNVEESQSLSLHVITLTFANLYDLIDQAKINPEGQRTALKAHAQSAERAEDELKKHDHLEKTLDFVTNMSDKHIDNPSKQDLEKFLHFWLN